MARRGASLPKSATPSCTLSQVLSFTLRRQGMTQRLPSIATHLFPLHATAHTTPVLSLLARVENISDLLPMYLQQSQVSPTSFSLMRCMRGTLHVIPAEHCQTVSRIYCSEGGKQSADIYKLYGIKADEVSYFIDLLRSLFLHHGPLSCNQAIQHIQAMTSLLYPVNTYVTLGRGQWTSTATNVAIALRIMFAEGRVQYGLRGANDNNDHDSDEDTAYRPAKRRKGDSGVCADDNISEWRMSRRKYGIASIVNGNSVITIDTSPPNQQQSAEAMTGLMLWYISLYGPVSLGDFVWWSACTVTICRAALTELLRRDVICEIHVENMQQVMYVCCNHVVELTSSPLVISSGVRFLPYEDALIKAYKETRYRFFCKENMGEIASMGEDIDALAIEKGVAAPTVWMDGKIIGTWKWHKNIKTTNRDGVEITTLRKIDAATKHRLRPELELLCSFLQVDIDNKVVYSTKQPKK